MQNPYVIAIGPLRSAVAQRVIRAAEDQAGEQVIVVAVLGEGARLADQRPDDVTVVDAMLAVAKQPRHAQQVGGATIDLQHLRADTHQQLGSDQP